MAGFGIAVSQDSFNSGLPTSENPKKNTENSAFRVTAAAVVQPEAGQSNYLSSVRIDEVPMHVVWANSQDHYTNQSVIIEDTEVQETTATVTMQIVVFLTYQTSCP